MHAKTGCECQPMRRWSAISGMRRVIETGLEFKKGSLAMTGKLSAPASRIQVSVCMAFFFLSSKAMTKT
jgi:hypothetical protein